MIKIIDFVFFYQFLLTPFSWPFFFQTNIKHKKRWGKKMYSFNFLYIMLLLFSIVYAQFIFHNRISSYGISDHITMGYIHLKNINIAAIKASFMIFFYVIFKPVAKIYEKLY